MPQAIERLLATPMMSPRLPCIRVPAGTMLSAPGALIRSFLVVVGDARRVVSPRGILYTICSAGPPGPTVFIWGEGPRRLLMPRAHAQGSCPGLMPRAHAQGSCREVMPSAHAFAHAQQVMALLRGDMD